MTAETLRDTSEVVRFKIADTWVGEGEPAFIVAEIGNNHNGSFEVALEMISAASRCGADAVKFQVKDVGTAFSKELLDKPYGGPHSFGATYREHKEALELSHDEYRALKDHAEALSMIWFATPFDATSLRFLKQIGVPAIKISSFHLTDDVLLRTACNVGVPLIVSTGMSTLEEIDHAALIIRHETQHGAVPPADFALLQCTSSYPAEDRDIHLDVIRTLSERYGCVVGYSGHDRGITIPAVSVCFGAKIIEKHFTLDRMMRGPDHATSLEIKGMSLFVERVRLVETATGSREKRVLSCEKAARFKNRGY